MLKKTADIWSISVRSLLQNKIYIYGNKFEKCKELYINHTYWIVSLKQAGLTVAKGKLPKMTRGRNLDGNQTQQGSHPRLGNIE